MQGLKEESGHDQRWPDDSAMPGNAAGLGNRGLSIFKGVGKGAAEACAPHLQKWGGGGGTSGF